LKLLPAQFTTEPDRLHRFEREARAASSLNHPNIITIHEVGQVEGEPFIITEFIEGKTLRQQMAAATMMLREALDVAIQVASALEAAHKAGIVHRDIKPENIMLRPDGLVKVLDFGLAKLTESQPPGPGAEATTLASVQTKTGLVMGTVTYMSPEQARGLAVDARSDIFSLGAVIYEMVAGRVPFEGATTSDVIVSILEREPAPLSRFAPEVPDELERIVKKALAKDQEERYQLAKDLLIDLRNLKQEMEVQAKLDAVRPAELKGATPAGLGVSVDTDEQLTTRSTDAEVALTVPTAAYLVGKVKTHKRAVALGLAVLIIAGAAIIYFIYFTRGEAIPETENAEAKKLYQQGLYYWRKNTDEATLESGEYFKQAIEKDPNFALAYVGLAEYYNIMAGFGNMRPNEALPKAEEAVSRALAIDEKLSGAHEQLASLKMWYDWDWSGAERELKRAIELNPEGEVSGIYNRLLEVTGRIDEAIADASVDWNQPSGSRLQREERLPRLLSLAGRYSEALEEWRKILEKQTNRRGMAHLNIGEIYARQGRYEEALAEMLEVRPRIRYPRELARIGYVYAAAGKRREAIKILEDMKDLTDKRYNLSTHIAAIYAALGNKDEALAWLKKACDEHEQGVVDLKVDPRLNTLRADPRFVDLLRRVKLAP
jgi:tetratricopeptide (TPR) repeat protein